MLYDKKYFIKLLKDIIEPTRRYYSSEGARLNIGHTGAAYEDDTIPMEGFSRILWGLAPLWAGGEACRDFQEIYLKGLDSGTDPESCEYWGNFRDYDQKFVEFAAIALGLLIAPDKLWRPLGDDVKKRVELYLGQINSYTVSDNNWHFFPLLVNLALKNLGLEYDSNIINRSLAQIESYYLGSGWYRDGLTGPCDYYISFAFHFYSLIYSKICYNDDRERCEIFRQRAAEFAKTFIYWFDNTGRALPYGRSLTYRFAQAAFWSACVFADLPVFSYGVIKGVLVKHLEEWLSHPIFDNDGILTIGYRYPNLHMAESYNSPGSPYWCLKMFILLAADDDHPFWYADIEAFPKLNHLKLLPEAQMLIQHFGNHITALVPGQLQHNVHDHGTEKYCKFAYSSEFAFSVPRSDKYLNQAAPDSMLSFEIDGYVFTRRVCDEIYTAEDEIVSKWSPFKGIEVVTTLIPTKNGHIRRHRISSEIECIARDAGFSVSCASDCRCKSNVTDEYAEVKNDFSYCRVQGMSCAGHEVLTMPPNTSLAYTKTLLPAAVYNIRSGINEIETEIMYN